MRLSFAVPFFALALAAACGDSGGVAVADACNPLGHPGAGCMLPWPSSSFQLDDAASPTGVVTALPLEAMPVNIDGIAIDPETWNRFDGASPSAAMVAAFPGGVAPDGLPTLDAPEASLEPDSAVMVVNLTTGEPVLVFAETDMNMDPAFRTLIIRPLERLQPGTRYAVGVRNTVKTVDGTPVARSPGFQALVDGQGFDHPRFARVAAGAPTMFAALAAAGMPEAELAMAWDFVTASDENLTSDLLTMRDTALPAMGEVGANLSFDITEAAAGDDRVYKAFLGTFTAPNFLSAGATDQTRMLRDAAGAPRLDGMFDANFAAIIPACVATHPLPLETVIFGHGLFGTGAGYVGDNFLKDMANEQCVVIFATDWIGLSEKQLALAAYSANDFNKSNSLAEMLGQSVINFIALEHLVRGPLLGAAEFSYEGQPIIDPNQMYYLGGSLGGIMGGTFMAYDPTIPRGVLGVPGGAWSMLIERSFAWTPLKVAATSAYEDPYDYQLLVSLLAMSLERWDPITTARRVLADPLPGTPAKQLFMYEAINDSLVTNLSTELVVRTMGIKHTAPSVREPFGIAAADGPEPSGFTIFDEHEAPLPTVNVSPSEDNGTHAGINERPAVIRAALRFLRDGEVVNECKDGETQVACDCSTGACD